MARVQALLRTRCVQGMLVAASALALVGWLLPLSEASLGQESAAKQPSVHALWQQARDCFLRGDYETAAVHYQQVKANQQQLSAGEQADLRELIAKNNVALQGLRAGRQQLGRAEEALEGGQPQEARGLLRTVMTNQFLSPDDRQKLNVLNERLRGMSAPNAVRASRNPMSGEVVAQNTDTMPRATNFPATPPAPKADPKALLGAARAALTKGDLDGAERLANDAKRAGSPGLSAWLVPWSDTPDKVLREVGVARARLAVQAPGGPAAEPAKSVWPGNPFARTQPKAPPPQQPQGNAVAQAPDAGTAPPKSVFAPAHVTGGGEQPLYGSTHVVIEPPPPPATVGQQPGRFAQTSYPQRQNPEAGLVPPPPGPLPSIDPPPLPAGNAVPPPVAPEVVKKSAPPAPQPNPTVEARKILLEGRKALKAGNIEAAQQLAVQAQSLRPRLNYWDDTPQKLLDDANRASAAAARQAAAKEGPAVPPPVAQPKPPQPVKVVENPRQQLRQARAAFAAGKLEDAESLLNSMNVAGVRWGLIEDNPQQLRSDIQRTRARRVLAEARRAFAAGNYEEAKTKAYQAQNLHGPYSVWDLSDRPQNLLGEIARAENAKRRQLPPANPSATETAKLQPAKNNSVVPPAPVTEKGTQMANAPLVPPVPTATKQQAPQVDPARQQAVALLAEARVYQQQGKLVEARQSALKAKSCGVAFGPNEDGPDVYLLQLSAACNLRVETMLRQAEQGIGKSADPGRYDRAQAELKQARELARAFGQDTVRIDQKCELLALEATLATRPAAAPEKGAAGQTVAQVAHQQPSPAAPVMETPSKGQTITIPQGTGEPKQGTGQTISIPQGNSEPKQGAGQTITVPQPPAEAVLPQPVPVPPAPVEAVRPPQPVVVPPAPAYTSRPPQPVNITPPVVQAPQVSPREHGLNLLDQSRRELRAGQTKIARSLAVEAFNPKYGVQQDAAALLRSIDAEEFNQRMLAANRAFDAGSTAFYRHDYRQARAVLAAVDVRMLTPDRQGRLKEIMQTSDMSPPPAVPVIAQVGGVGTPNAQGVGGAPGKVTVSDGNDEDFAANYRALEEVKFQQMRSDSLRTQNDAMQRFRNGDTDVALEMLSEHLGRLNDAQLSPERLALLRRPVEDRLQKLRTLTEQRKLAGARADNLGATGHTKELLRRKAEVERHEKVADLVKQANEFYKEGKYRETLMLAQKARDIEPGNVAADAIEKIATMQMNLQASKQVSQDKERMFFKAMTEAEEPGPYAGMANPMVFDKAGQSRMNRRLAIGYGKGELINRFTPKQLEIERKLLIPVSPNYKDLPLDQAVSDLSDYSGVNIFFDKAAVDESGINLKLPTSLRATEPMSLKSTLEILLSPAKLTYVVKSDCVWITTEERGQGRLVTKTYSVADLVIPVENFVLPDTHSINAVLQRITNSQGIPGSQTPTPFTSPLGLTQGPSVSTFQGSQANAASGSGFGAFGAPGGTLPGNSPVPGGPKGPGRTIEETLIKLIQSTVHPTTWSDVGGQGTIQYYPLGMALVVNQTPNIQEEIEQLLVALRRLQDLEVAIEVRVIGLSEEFFERIGLDFNLNIQTHNTRFQPMLTTQQFTPPGQINTITAQGVTSGLTPAGTLTRDLGIPIRNSSFDFSIPPFGGFPGTLGADGGLALGLAFLSDIQVFMFMEAAQGDQRTNLMQAPKLTMFNGQTATITVTDFQFLLTSIQPINVGSLLFFAPINTPVPLGIAMTVQPVVSADRRFVRISMVPTITSIAPNIGLFPIQVPVQSVFDIGGGGTVAGQLQNVFQTFLQQPNLTSINVTTTVTVPDGGTVLLGGVKTLVEARNEFGPPILSKIPYLSRLFRNTSYGRETRTLMIMVTPRIIINEEEEEQQVGTPEVSIPRQ